MTPKIQIYLDNLCIICNLEQILKGFNQKVFIKFRNAAKT